MANLYITSDNHFLHKNIVKYCNRPENHNRLMIDNWNNTVKDEDYVIVAGDFSAGVGAVQNGVELLKKISKSLKGHKFLVKGNHDHFSDDFYINELGFEKVMGYMIYKDNLICHYPLEINTYTKNPEEILALINLYKEKGVNNVYCGHSHSNKFTHLPNHINIGVDLNNFTPVLLDSNI